MPEVQSSIVTDDGVRLTYKVAGKGARDLLLMHGWGGSANNWRGFIQSLDLRTFRTVAFDFRAHGNSDKVTMGFTDERFAKDALTVADAANSPKFTAIGFSICAVPAAVGGRSGRGNGGRCRCSYLGDGALRAGGRGLGGQSGESREAPGNPADVCGEARYDTDRRIR